MNPGASAGDDAGATDNRAASDSPQEPLCEDCNDIGRIPVLVREICGPVFTEWKFVTCPCQTKT